VDQNSPLDKIFVGLSETADQQQSQGYAQAMIVSYMIFEKVNSEYSVASIAMKAITIDSETARLNKETKHMQQQIQKDELQEQQQQQKKEQLREDNNTTTEAK
jgi:hypothetical protein